MLKAPEADRILWTESLRGGQMWSHVLRRGQTLRVIDVEGGATPALLLYNAALPLERYNMPDTLKAQQIARLTQGAVLYSDMGRILASITQDSAGWHDTITGHMTAEMSVAKYGEGAYQQLRNDFHRNTRDNFLTELGKYGLGERDLVPNVNLFTQVRPDENGALSWADSAIPAGAIPAGAIPAGASAGAAKAGAGIDLRAEMDVLLVLSNTPHPWDPSPTYAPKPVDLLIYRADPVGPDDACRNFRPENRRGFELTEQYVRFST